MIKGIYTAASGMLAESIRTDVTANNLANAATTGFKKDIAVNQAFNELLIKRINDDPEQIIGRIGTGAEVAEISSDHSQGALRYTGNMLDIAVAGKGFIAVNTPAGLRYTRAGNFFINSNAELVTGNGHQVMGDNGRIVVDGQVNIDPTGVVTVDGVAVNRLRFVEFVNEQQLVKEGESLFNANGAAELAASGQLHQGALEMSNVNAVGEMVNLISGYRAYEINAKSIQTHDQLLEKAANEVGKV